MHSGASSARNGDALFFMLGWDQYGFDKKRDRTHYAELVFLHPVRSTSPIQYFGMSGVSNADALFLMLRWDRYEFDKNKSGHITPNLCFFIRSDLRFT
jgi:hypothetical protein